MWYTEPSKPLNLQKVQESPIRGGIIEESINDTHKWEAERMARNILVVEDDRNISDLIRMYLEKEGFEVRSAYDGGKAVEEFDKQAPDMVLLDIMLPGMDGFAVCRELRQRSETMGIIMLTARTQEMEKVGGLMMGADDYVTKPFNPLELVARVKSQLRRYTTLSSTPSGDAVYEAGGLVINDELKKVTVDGEEVKLTPIEYNILLLLMKNKGKVFSISQIYEEIWNEEAIGADNTVAVHIRHIREKIEINPKEPRYLKVVWGVGYKIEAGA